MGLGKTLQTVAFFAALLGCTGSRRTDSAAARSVVEPLDEENLLILIELALA